VEDPTWLSDLVARGGLVYCGFDLDPTGEAMADSMIALHPSIQRLRAATRLVPKEKPKSAANQSVWGT
jgi:hypothetical protein